MFLSGRHKVERTTDSTSDTIGYVQVIKGKLLIVYECYYSKGFPESHTATLIFSVSEAGD